MEAVGIRQGRASSGGSGQRIVIVLVLLFVAGALIWGVTHLTHGATQPKRQVAKIMILPDTPPPPPPEEKTPPPKEEQQRVQQINTPKQETPPAPAQLKMEGAAGDGPSAFAAGDVKQDYIGGDIGNGSRFSAYVARLEQRVQVELTRHKLHLSNVKLFIWLSSDGTIQRYKVEGGDGDTERNLRVALADFSRVDEAPLSDMPMPVGLSIN